MTPRARFFTATLLCSAFLIPAATAGAAETVAISSASLSPDRLGVPTDLFAAAKLRAPGHAIGSPITHVNLYGPLGSTLNLEGAGTCHAALLENVGSEACPADSRLGSGGGEALYELAGELVKEKFTLALFLGDAVPGQQAVLIYMSGSTPFPVQEVLTAQVTQGPTPYGFGLSVEVPLLKVLPEATFASPSSMFVTLGAANLSYYKTVRGRRRLVHLKGLVAPKSCPRGGWIVASQLSFMDGSKVTARRRIPCPRR